MIKFYLSSVDTEYKMIDRMFSRGYPSFGVQVSYAYLSKHDYLLNVLKKWNVDYKVRIYIMNGIDSVNRSKQKLNKIVNNVNESDAYFSEYLDWLIKYQELYENAYEFRFTGMDVGKLSEYRKIYEERGLSKHIIIGITKETGVAEAKELILKGFQWFYYDGNDASETELLDLAKQISELGASFHLNSFNKYEIYDVRESIGSVDTSAWLTGSLEGKLYFFKSGRLKIFDITDYTALDAISQDRFWNAFPDEVRKDVKDGKGGHYYNAWNAYAFIQYVDHLNSKIPAYKDYLKNGGDVPEFGMEVDKSGRDKISEIAKFKNLKTGVFSRRVMDYGLQCNTCVIRDRCVAYKKDSVCAYTSVWEKTGSLNTRNVEAVISSLESLIEEQNQRLIRAQFIESQKGGSIDKNVTELQNSLIRNMDILYKLKFGSTNQNKFNFLNVGTTQMMVGDAEDMLSAVRKGFKSDKESDEDTANESN